jgi:hypothetical protein
VVVGLGIFTAVAPLIGSMLGVLPESVRFVNGSIVLLPIAVEFTAQGTPMMLVMGFVGTIALASYVVGRVRDSAVELAGARAMQSWNLAQLVPPEAAPRAQQQLDAEAAAACPITRAVDAMEAVR